MPHFHTTRWSLVAAAQGVTVPSARQALSELCTAYWYPLYAFIRRTGRDPHAAEDLTQEFFARLLAKHGLAGANESKGRFRNYLLGACRHFLANEHDRTMAAKRGGGQAVLSLDFANAERRYLAEPEGDRAAEQLFERQWAVTLLDRTLTDLRAEYAASDSEALFDQLKESLTGEGVSYATIAEALDMSEGAVKVAAHRLRQRYRNKLRSAIADTVESADEIDDEIRALFAALR